LHLWVDATAGIAGDMLLGALIDAGAPLDRVESAVSALVPGEVALRTSTVHRAGLRALKLDVESRADEHPHRSWADIRALLETAELPSAVRTPALEVFARLADAEGRVHGVLPDDVHFHEVGSWDSIADIVGVCAALAGLAVTRVTASPVAVGSGRIGSVHGDLPVPPPAVLELARGWRVLAGGEGELATPTGMALIRALADECGSIGPMEITAVGVGAGGRDVPGRANVVRVALGIPIADVPTTDSMWVLETNIDDLDPRVWPTVLAALLEAGAADAWLVPIVMKKGRPAHTVHVLCDPSSAPLIGALLLRETGSLGLRGMELRRWPQQRSERKVVIDGHTINTKVALGRVKVEYDDAAAAAAALGRPLRDVLAEAAALAERDVQ